MPQIAQIAATYSSQIFWLLLTFGFVFVVIGLGMVPKVQSTVDMRNKKIADDLAAAKVNSEAADGLEEDWRQRENEARAEAQSLMAEAKTRSIKESEAIVAVADAELAEKIAAAEARIAQSSAGAMDEIRKVAAEAAADMVQRLAGADVTPQAAAKAVKAAMSNG